MARVRAAGLEDRIDVLLKDYRDLEGTYDRLVSIEMIEAVGHRFYDDFFRVCSERLAPDGMMLLQAITIQDQQYRAALDSGRVDGALGVYRELLEEIEQNPDRYYEQGREYFNTQSAEALRDAMTLQDAAASQQKGRMELERRLKDAQDQIARQQEEIQNLREMIEDMQRSRSRSSTGSF